MSSQENNSYEPSGRKIQQEGERRGNGNNNHRNEKRLGYSKLDEFKSSQKTRESLIWKNANIWINGWLSWTLKNKVDLIHSDKIMTETWGSDRYLGLHTRTVEHIWTYNNRHMFMINYKQARIWCVIHSEVDWKILGMSHGKNLIFTSMFRLLNSARKINRRHATNCDRELTAYEENEIDFPSASVVNWTISTNCEVYPNACTPTSLRILS